MAAAGLVGQSHQTRLEKTLHPLIDKAPADPNSGSNVGDWHAIGDE
jgi:hypothetical protein